MNKKSKYIALLIILIASCTSIYSQKNTASKYPSLFWEISGNGLKKPSYLFGTMHVSNKMVFHLSDSFYYAMKSVDAVALELNPDVWQGKMVRLDQTKQNYAEYVKAPSGDLLTESSFKIDKYWMYTIYDGQKPLFFTTSDCTDESLKEKIHSVFSECLNPL